MKFSTDVLLIAPAVMGIIFSISRIWDAISDPIAGYLSDRTTFKFGRRRTWMLLSFVPISFGFLAVFSPPESMQGQSLDLWMMIAILSFYSAITLFNVPHMALGAELTDDYHERTRLFGVRHIGFTFGSILSLVSMSLLISEENSPTGDVRELASNLAFFAVAVMSLMIFFSVSRLKEDPKFQNRVNKNPFRAFRDIWVNPHAKILIIVLFIENLGGAGDRCSHLVCNSIYHWNTSLSAFNDFSLYAAFSAFGSLLDTFIEKIWKNKSLGFQYGFYGYIFWGYLFYTFYRFRNSQGSDYVYWSISSWNSSWVWGGNRTIHKRRCN
jgi:Na+/melibiose symporter-like transporter